MYLNFKARKFLFFIVPILLFALGCTRSTEEVDLVNNEVHRQQAYKQILNNPELQQEFMGILIQDKEAMKRMMRDRQFTGELFNRENLNYIWDNNPGIDSAVVDNITTRMHTDTNFMKLIDDRMESGTPTGTP